MKNKDDFYYVSEGGVRYSKITLCLLYFICKDCRPFTVIEGEGLNGCYINWYLHTRFHQFPQ